MVEQALTLREAHHARGAQHRGELLDGRLVAVGVQTRDQVLELLRAAGNGSP